MAQRPVHQRDRVRPQFCARLQRFQRQYRWQAGHFRGLSQVYAGAAAAGLIGVEPADSRVPDIIGIAQYGVVYTSHKSKIAEHGGDHVEDRNVPILVAWPGASGGTAVTRPVETTQIAPTILKLLGLNPGELRAVHLEGTQPL